MVVEIDIIKKSEEFDLFVGDDCGGSGISISGKTTEEVIDNLIPYLRDYLEQVDNENDCE